MLGGNSERIKRISIRSGLFNIFAKNEYELDPGFAHISPIKNEHQEPIGYAQNVQYLAGVIEDIQLQRRTRKMGTTARTSDFIDIYLNSGGTNIIIELNFDSGPGKSFAATFRNLIPYLGNVVCIKAYQMTPAEGQENGRQGVLIYPNSVAPIMQKGAHLPSFYVSAKTEVDPNKIEGTHYFRIPTFEKPGRTGAMEYDKEAASNWLYTAFREEIYSVYNHYELAEEVPSSQIPQQTYQAPPLPAADNFYANQSQGQPRYPQSPQQGFAQGPPPPAAVQNTHQNQNIQGPPLPNVPQRPQRTEAVTHMPVSNQTQPMYEQVTPQTPPPPPTRDYRQPEPSTRTAPPPPGAGGQAYNANAGMTNRPPIEEAFSPLPDDDLPF
jgi:hypothetical protein